MKFINSEKAKKARVLKAKGLKIKDISEKLGVSRQMVTKYLYVPTDIKKPVKQMPIEEVESALDARKELVILYNAVKILAAKNLPSGNKEKKTNATVALQAIGKGTEILKIIAKIDGLGEEEESQASRRRTIRRIAKIVKESPEVDEALKEEFSGVYDSN